MFKLLFLILVIIVNFLFPAFSQAQSRSFVTIVNPVRGNDFWDIKEKPVEAVLGQKEILQKYKIPATWLIRYDVLQEADIINIIKSGSNNEIGLLLEVTPSWTTASQVNYRSSKVWHNAGSVFLTGYTLDERRKLIDQTFKRFEDVLGYYPKSVGAWWIDSYSLRYMQEKYQVTSALIVADQYSTDNYQIWGQYFATPYYPAKNNLLMPAQSRENKLPVVIMQWASRDPVNGYGKGVEESTYSVQANDYVDYHGLTTAYFTKLLNILTQQKLNQFNQVVIGLENSYPWPKYRDEYENEIKVIADKRQNNEVELSGMEMFADWYQKRFPDLSPDQIIVADDPLGSRFKAVWFMNNYYRAGWFYNQDGSVFRDVRQYLEGQNELCFNAPCQEVNFAKFSTRVLDEVTYNNKMVVDPGRISGFKVEQKNGEYILNYQNEAGRNRIIKFMPRDIAVDKKISSIDGFILDAGTYLQPTIIEPQVVTKEEARLLQESALNVTVKVLKFMIFLVAVLFIPGFALTGFLKQKSFTWNVFLSLCSGIVFYTLVSFVSGLLQIWWLPHLYITISALLLIKIKLTQGFGWIVPERLSTETILATILILTGTVFQSLAMVRSGWMYDFGVGFFGPTGHDGIWHQALINQLTLQIPPQNPGLSGVVLSNYHYFYDLLVAATFGISNIPVTDLLFRFYPVLFSLLLGLGTWVLCQKLFNHKGSALLSLYFIYFAGSFGWIVEFLKNKTLGGESDFWVNQPISMNLNPPFAVSLVLLIAIVLLIRLFQEKTSLPNTLLIIVITGSLMEFKIYSAVIVLGALLMVTIYQLIIQRNTKMIPIFAGSLLFSLALFYPQNTKSSDLLVLAPFWFVHSMIDFPDRVGWARLSSARDTYYLKGQWFKYLLAETLGFLMFVFGNLGTRLVAFFVVMPLVIKNKLFDKMEYNFIFCLMLLSLVIPTFLIQKGNPWNTIQFFYYFLYFAAILSGLSLVWLFRRLPRLLAILLILIILVITPINAWTTFREGLSPNSPARLTLGEFEALNYLKGLPRGIVLTYPYNKNLKSKLKAPYPLIAYETSVYVAAFSGKQVYLEDEIQQDILQTSYQKRRVESLDFFKGREREWLSQFLETNKIRYIYLPKILNISLDINDIKARQVFENSEVIIYEIIA